MTPQYTLAKAKVFDISNTEAKFMRVNFLKERIQDFEARIQNALKIYWSETSATGQDLLLDRVLIPHWKQIFNFYTELENWSKPIYQNNGNLKSFDWDKVALYPCVDLLGNPFKKTGKEWIYHAPHREDKNPSFAVNIEKNIWHDWGTGQGGNVFDLYILINGGDKINAYNNLNNL